MAFLKRPAWYGRPVFVRRNVRRYLRSFAILFLLSLLFAFGVSSLPSVSDDESFRVFIEVLFSSLLVVIFFSGCFLAVFFWFRGAVNTIAASRHPSPTYKRWSWQSLFIPFYGWRKKDLSDEGLRYRRLVIEGVVGFAGTILFVFLFVFLGELAGLDVIAE